VVVTHEPKTFAELQKFYTDVYTPLYDRFINSGAAPQELHAEAAVAKSRRQKVISIVIWLLGIVLGAMLGKLF